MSPHHLTQHSTPRTLAHSLPAPLSSFYHLIGDLPQFTSHLSNSPRHYNFRDADGLLMFLQGATRCLFLEGDAQERAFQCHAAQCGRFDEQINLSAFPELIMYYQVKGRRRHI